MLGKDLVKAAQTQYASESGRREGLERLAAGGGCRQGFGQLVKPGIFHSRSLL